MVTPLAYYDLIETFPEPGCAICSLRLRDEKRYLDSLLYEYVNEAETHRAFRAGRGLCNAHGWLLIDHVGNSLGIAILYRAVVDEVLKVIERTPAQGGVAAGLAALLGSRGMADGSTLADRLEPDARCPACDSVALAERRYVETFTGYFGEGAMEKAFQASAGLCLPHLRQALRIAQPGAQLQRIVAVQTEIWGRLKRDLETFADKSVHERQHETMGDERDSWQRAIASMAGARGVRPFGR